MASQFGEGDLGIVNYALTLEYLETAFYNDAAKSGLFKGDDLALIKHIADTEQQHVDALTATAKKLGGPAAKAPKAEFPLKDPTSVLKLAATVENLGAAAYLGQAANIQSPDILAAALCDPLGRGHATRRRSTCSPARSRPRTGRSPRAPTCRKSSTRSSRSSSKATEREKEATCNRHKQGLPSSPRSRSRASTAARC